MLTILGNNASGLSTVQKRAAEFRRRNKSCKHPRSGCPATAERAIDRVYVLMYVSRLTINQIAKVINIFLERARNILHVELGMPKVSTR